MRTMPTHIDRHPIPTISEAEFDATLQQIAGRALTDREHERVQRMSAHNWTLRAQATELFGTDLVDAFYAPQD